MSFTTTDTGAKNTPDWLNNLFASTAISNRRIRKLLDESFFYAAAGWDTQTLLQHADAFRSFVYVDILPDEREKFFEVGIPHYRRVFRKSLPGETVIKGGWPVYERYFDIPYEIPVPFTTELAVYDLLEAPIGEDGMRRPLRERIAVLYVHGECINAFAALYVQQRIAPRAIYFIAQMDPDLNVAMLCPGHSFSALLAQLPEHKPGMLRYFEGMRERYAPSCPAC
jgi:hypothetical protein